MFLGVIHVMKIFKNFLINRKYDCRKYIGEK